jgi:phosphonate transport system substrate-binding protein
MQAIKLRTTLVVVLALFAGFSLLPGMILAQDTERTSIVLADISNDPADTIKEFQPLADYMAAHLEDYGIESGDVIAAPDMPTLIEMLAAGEIDVYFDSAFPVMFISGETGVEPILRRWKDGVGEYHSVFFALADSELETLEDLQGQLVAFDTPFSTSGYMLPLAWIIENDLVGVEIDRDDDDPQIADDEIGYIFSEDDNTTVQWVISGRTAAGVVDSETYLSIPEETREHMVILAETGSVPRHIAVVRDDLDPELVDRIRALLLEMTETDEGLLVLEGFNTSQFDEFPDGAAAALDDMQAMFDLVTVQADEE